MKALNRLLDLKQETSHPAFRTMKKIKDYGVFV